MKHGTTSVMDYLYILFLSEEPKWRENIVFELIFHRTTN